MPVVFFVAGDIIHFIAASSVQIESGLFENSAEVCSEVSEDIDNKVLAISYKLHSEYLFNYYYQISISTHFIQNYLDFSIFSIYFIYF